MQIDILRGCNTNQQNSSPTLLANKEQHYDDDDDNDGQQAATTTTTKLRPPLGDTFCLEKISCQDSKPMPQSPPAVLKVNEFCGAAGHWT